MADQLTNALLWTMVLLGVWNGVNMAARIYYRVPWWPYSWSVISGAWAAAILFLR